jgi:hypothetical protein
MAYLLLLLSVAGPYGSAPLTGSPPSWDWDEDFLIWDMTENSTYSGPGYSYCDGIFDLQGDQYAVSIVDSTGDQGDVLKIFNSADGGQSWSLANFATGGSWVLTDPALILHGTNPDPDSNYISIFITATYPDSSAGPLGFRLLRSDFSFDGFMQPPWVPGVDTLRSLSVVCQTGTNELWLFGENTDQTIWLTRSPDNGETWTDLELMAEDAVLPSAEIGPGSWVYMTYKRFSDNMILCTSFSDQSYYETEVTQGAATSAPICASERTGAGILSIIFHDQNYDIRMALSEDHGATWSLSAPISKGLYPFIDVFRTSTSSALSYIDYTTGEIMFANAPSLTLLPGQKPDPISGQYVFLGGPAVVRHGVLPTEVSIFYMGRGEGSPASRDLWYDSSLLTPHGVHEDPLPPLLTVGPNPFSSMVSFRFTLDVQSECSLNLYSLDGRLVERVFSGITDGEELQAGANLPAGVYSAVFRVGEETGISRLIKL